MNFYALVLTEEQREMLEGLVDPTQKFFEVNLAHIVVTL